MQRKQLVVGDLPICGGRILPYQPAFSFQIGGHQVALIGGRVYCEGCHSIGVIAKAGGPRRANYISEVALEGDVCVCQCPRPQPLKSTLQSMSTYDDGAVGAASIFDAATMLVPGGLALWREEEMAASRKVVDEQVAHPPEAAQTENICPNMTNKEFAELVLTLRDEAVVLVGERLAELELWDAKAQKRVFEWFGNPGPLQARSHLNELRDYLRNGLKACDRVLRGMRAENFVRWSTTAHKHVGCINSKSDVGLNAEVCRPDIATRTIAIALQFCRLPRDFKIYGTEKIRDGDSQLLTLVHEVTHFRDVFDSSDDWYGTKNSRDSVLSTGDFAKARVNADSLSGYIVGVQKL